MFTRTKATVAIAAIAAAIVLIGLFTLMPSPRQMFGYATGLVTGLGWAAGAVYAAFYAVVVMLSLPSTPLDLAAGVLFGLVGGFLAAQTGCWAGAMGSFLIARHLAGDRIRKKVASHPMFETLSAAVEHEGFKVVLFARLNPFIPASVKSYGFGLSVVPFRDYALATLIGQIPLTLLYVYLGSIGQTAILQPQTFLDPGRIALILVGLAMSIALVWAVTRYGRNRLARYEGA